MNIANSYAAAIITRKFKDKLGDISNIFPSFDLVKTTEGSLKLGLKSAPFYLENEDWKQASLFEPDEKQQEINQLKNFADSTSVTLDAFKLITKTLAAANDNDEMDELKRDFDEKEVIKLNYFAKELALSNRSGMDEVFLRVQSLINQ